MTDWHNLYGKGWTGIITPESFAHPAKFARGLIRHIYQHLFDEGWLQLGDTVLDPFGGVGLGALHAMQRGLHWIGVELEQKFVDLGCQNIDLWNARFGPHLPNWGSAVLLQGDSRYLAEVVGEAGGLVGSPPYMGSLKACDEGDDKVRERYPGWKSTGKTGYERRYSTNPANLGNMAAGEVDGVIGSPPYAESVNDWRRLNLPGRQIEGKGGYGYTKGQLAAMPQGPSPGAGQVADGLVGSPPWESSLDNILPRAADGKDGNAVAVFKRTGKWPERRPAGLDYGQTDGQLGQESGTTFWSAARLILQQCYQVLKPDAVAVWVVKSFVRKGKRVDFPGQWRQLCESCGFETVHEHRAWLVEDRGNARALFNFEMENGDARIAVEAGSVMHRKGKELKSAELKRASFFRRLAERNARADKLWPTVSRDDQATYLWQAHGQLWRQYRRRVAGDLLPSELPDDEPSPPTRSGILRNAKSLAYVEAGSPDIEIATQIDYEVVLCTIKR